MTSDFLVKFLAKYWKFNPSQSPQRLPSTQALKEPAKAASNNHARKPRFFILYEDIKP